jgi:hypothetical protein
MKRTALTLILLVACAIAFGQAKKAKRDTLYTITQSRIHIKDGKPTDAFDIINLKWADTLWHVSRDLDMEQPNLAINNYRWFFYDKDKNLTRFERYVAQKLDRRIVYKLQNGLATEREHYQLEGKDTMLFRRDLLSRGGNGWVSSIKVVDAKGKKIATQSYNYDDKGNEVKMKASMKVILDADSALSRQTTYTYDSVGRVAKKIVKLVKADKSKDYTLYAYTYNKDGKLQLTSRFDANGKQLGKEEIIYYSGRVSQRKYYDGNGTLYENMAYRYRKFGASLDNDMY